MSLKLVLVLILSSMVVLFIAQNVAIVEIGFLFGRWSMSSAVLVIASVMSGFLLGWLLHSYLLARKSKATLIKSTHSTGRAL